MGGKDLRSGGGSKLWDGVVSNLRACLLSTKTGVSIRSLDNDYKQIVGENIPFRKLGCSTLNEFLTKVPGIVISHRGGEMMISARPTEESAHITDMIARQKTSSKKRPRASLTYELTENDTINLIVNPRFLSSRKIFQWENANINVSGAMETSAKQPISSLFERPRYMLSNSTPQSSPSKRLRDRNSSAAASKPTNSIPPLMASATLHPNTQKRPTSMIPYSASRVGQSSGSSADLGSTCILQRLKLSERLTIKPQLPELPVVQSPSSHPSAEIRSVSPGQALRTAGSEHSHPQVDSDTPEQSSFRRQISFAKSQKHDPCMMLQLLTKALNLPEPVYKTVPRQRKRLPPVMDCQVKIGSDSYSSYPEEKMTVEEAGAIAAMKAIKEINSKYGPISGLSETTSKSIIKERVIALVSQHENGVFMEQIPTYYKEQFEESLPEEWRKIIEECSDILKDKGANNSTILRSYIVPTERIKGIISPKMEKIELSPIGPAMPGILLPPADSYWDVNITCVMSTVDIAVRLIGEEYSDKFESMTSDLAVHYDSIAIKSASCAVKIGNYYAVYQDESWHRVRCLEIDVQAHRARVFFIDLGDEDCYDQKKLFPLDKRFCKVPAQAMTISLADLEEFSECTEILEELEELLLGRTLVAQVVSRDSCQEEPMATVILYDTYGESDINLNEIFFGTISQRIFVPKLQQEGRVTEVFISHVTDSGLVYVQVKSESIYHLRKFMTKLLETALTEENQVRSSVKTIDTTKIYLTRCFEDGNWYRGIVADIIPPNNQLKMFLIDSGKTIIVSKEHLLLLESLSKVLNSYPRQALQVRLHNVSEQMFSNRMAARLVALAPPHEKLLVKVVTPASGEEPPIVELFKRFQPNDVLVSINNTIVLDHEQIGSEDKNNNTKPRRRVERTVSRHGAINNRDSTVKNLFPPKIPDFGQYFDVHVTMAAHPGNFTVQPYDSRLQLEAMMIQLQEECLLYAGSPLTSDSIKEGSLFAAQHIDGHWYRVCIFNVINEHMVTVYFCDFGDVSVITLDKLQPLGSHFLDLPYQAIKARLVGIQPLNIDWSVGDCIRFQELVVERNFVSTIVESAPDRLSPADIVLGLNLIDVSSVTDVYIDSLLVKEGRAIFIDG